MSDRKGMAITLLVLLSTIHYSLSTASAQTTGGSYDGFDTYDGSDVGLGGTEVRFSSASHQVFMAGQGAREMAPVYIKDVAGGLIMADNTSGDIRIKVPAAVNMEWDASAATAVLGGNAAAKCDSTVSFEDANKTARLDVTGNFSAKEVLIVSGLRFFNFTGASTADNLELEVANNGQAYSWDDKVVVVVDTAGALPTGFIADGYDSGIGPDYNFGSSHRASGATFEGLRFE